jgi:aryl-alcohol dehydrogenase-like predicted oxidoreductase
MTTRRLGNSGLLIFPLILGGNTFGWTADAAESEAVLDAFVGGGGNFVDSAASYAQWKQGNSGGESEEILGAWMQSRRNRDQVIVATKVGKLIGSEGLSASNIYAATDASLARLKTDYIDVYYAHADDPETPIIETAVAFDELVKAGKVRHIGLSNYSGSRFAEYLEVAKANDLALPVVVQPHYNLVFRKEYETDLGPVAARTGISCAPYFSLGSGLLTGKYAQGGTGSPSPKVGVGKYEGAQVDAVVQALIEVADECGAEPASVALAWLLTRPTVVGPIASARVIEQLPALMASATLNLSMEQVDRLTTASDGL